MNVKIGTNCILKKDIALFLRIYGFELLGSPEGKFYKADAHEVDAEHLCDILYGKDFGIHYAGDYLEEHGWVRLTTSLMWEVRDNYWFDKDLTQAQLDALWDWCELHNKHYPY